MPSFAATLQDEEIWKIAMFLKQMDKLPPTVDAEWKKVPSVAATPPTKIIPRPRLTGKQNNFPLLKRISVGSLRPRTFFGQESDQRLKK
jgi:hypothetical protein